LVIGTLPVWGILEQWRGMRLECEEEVGKGIDLLWLSIMMSASVSFFLLVKCPVFSHVSPSSFVQAQQPEKRS
jgi:hypothetical protein